MSLQDIERNDVDISKLFSYKDNITLEVPGTKDEIIFYQRVVGDAQIGQARTYALRKSAELREKLKDIKWEDRLAYLPNLSKLKKEELVDLILGMSVQELTLKVINNTDLAHPAELDGETTLEQQEAYQKEVDSYPERFQAKIIEGLDKELKSLRIKLNKVKKDDLVQKYEIVIINQHASEIFSVSYNEMCTYFGTFIDEGYTKLAFISLESFTNAPSKLKKALITNYTEIEISSGSLKKSPEVTQ